MPPTNKILEACTHLPSRSYAVGDVLIEEGAKDCNLMILEFGQVEIVKRDIVDYLRETGAVPSSINMTISGASDQLQATREALAANYVVAIIIIYLLLVAIFTHWGYPLLIMTTISLGVAGIIYDSKVNSM